MAEDFFSAVVALSSGTDGCAALVANHSAAWRDVWRRGHVDLSHQGESPETLELRKVVLGSQYYLYSSLPVAPDTYRPRDQFYGLSPGGLARGTMLLSFLIHLPQAPGFRVNQSPSVKCSEFRMHIDVLPSDPKPQFTSCRFFLFRTRLALR